MITWDRKSFLVDGRRIWLHSAAIHYFRHPCELWEEALLRARRAGYNTVETYVAWNFHEPVEGHLDFSGDRDLGRFLDLAHRLGMYAVVRPGPFICSEWDAGAFPAWLYDKPGIDDGPHRWLRELNPSTVDCLDRWFDHLLPIIASRQVSVGGPVVLVQNENEFRELWNESARRYLDHISAAFRRHGITVPIIACNAHQYSATEVKINGSRNRSDMLIEPDMIVTYNCGGAADPVRDLRRFQPDAPVFVTEFWHGPVVTWGAINTDRWPIVEDQSRSQYELASMAAMTNAYMFDGGTNFGFWGGANMATSYEAAYPVGEGGLLREKYYRLKPVGHFIEHFGDFLAESEEVEESRVVVPSGVRRIERSAPDGRLLFITAADSRVEIPVGLADGRELLLRLTRTRGAVLPVGLQVLPGVKLDYANVSLLARNTELNTVVLYGEAGTEARFSVNGQEHVLSIPARGVVRVACGDAVFLLIDEEMAERSWFVEGAMLFGPDYVGARLDGETYVVRSSAGTPPMWRLDRKGTLHAIPAPPVPAAEPAPSLKSWQVLELPEAAGGGDGWQALDRPVRHESVEGGLYGYVWYRAEVECDTEQDSTLFFAKAHNPIHVFHEGRWMGTFGALRNLWARWDYGHPADAFRELVPVRLHRGVNRFAFLSDNNGRENGGGFDPQGIEGPVYAGARRVIPDAVRQLPPAPVSPEIFRWAQSKDFREARPLPAIEFDLPLAADEVAYLHLNQHHCGSGELMVTFDGRHVPPLPLRRYPFNVVAVPPEFSGRTAKVRIQYLNTDPERLVDQGVLVYVAPRKGELGNWAVKPMGDPSFAGGGLLVMTGEASGVGNDPVVILPEVKNPERGRLSGRPAFFRTTFPRPSGKRPVFVEVGAMKKGQIYLNGRNCGRLNTVSGIWTRYYLPRPWMRDDNELVILEELGVLPHGAVLRWGGGDFAEPGRDTP